MRRALLALDVSRGDRVAVLLPNRPEWLITAFAAAKVGAPLVAISTFSTPREIAWTLEHARPRVIVTMDADLSHDPSLLPRLIDAVDAGADMAVGSRRVPGSR